MRIDSCIGRSNKKTFFYCEKDAQTLENWFGQCILLDHDSIISRLPQDHYGCPQFLTRYGYTAVEIEQKKLSEILSAIEFPVIDICDFDIQGMEFETIEESIEILNSQVKRLHIGTHSSQIEQDLKQLLACNGWRLIRDYPFAQTNHTPYGDIQFVDGVQTWHNERFDVSQHSTKELVTPLDDK